MPIFRTMSIEMEKGEFYWIDSSKIGLFSSPNVQEFTKCVYALQMDISRCIQIPRRDSTWNAETTNQRILHLKLKTPYTLRFYLIYYPSRLFT